MAGENENSNTETANDHIDLAVYRKLVKQFIDMVSERKKQNANKKIRNLIILPLPCSVVIRLRFSGQKRWQFLAVRSHVMSTTKRSACFS